MAKSSTSIGLLLIVYSIFLGPVIWLQSSGILKGKNNAFDEMEILPFCILAGLVIAGILFMMGKRFAVYITILTFLLIIIENLIGRAFDLFSFLSCLIIPVIFIVYIIKSKVYQHLM